MGRLRRLLIVEVRVWTSLWIYFSRFLSLLTGRTTIFTCFYNDKRVTASKVKVNTYLTWLYLRRCTTIGVFACGLLGFG